MIYSLQVAFLVTVALISSNYGINAAKIIMYNPYFAHSHFNFIAKLSDILQDSGHNVTVIIPEIDPKINIGSKKAEVIIRAPIKEENNENVWSSNNGQNLMWGLGYEALKMAPLTEKMHKTMNAHCSRMLEDKNFIEKLKNQKYDFGIFEPIDFCGYGLFKLIGVNEYAISTPMTLSHEIALALGLPGRNVQFPSNHDYHPDMTFSERLINHFSPIFFQYFNTPENAFCESLIKKYVDPNFSKFEAIANSRYIFVNNHELTDFPRPSSSKIIHIGGITCDITSKTNDNLNFDYQNIFDSTNNGVVLVSFGSLAKSSDMPKEYQQALIKTFEKFPEINFIWKYENENDSIANNLPNVFKRKWIPQKEILANPKLLAFITHGGMNSITEAAHYGIPLLAISLFADQHRNSKMLEYRKTAIVLPKFEITENSLFEGLKKLIHGKSAEKFRKRAKTLATMLASKPMTPKERFVKNINFAIAFKNEDDHLDIKTRNHNFIKFYNVDIYFAAFFVVFAFLYLVLVVFKFVRHIFVKIFNLKEKIL